MEELTMLVQLTGGEQETVQRLRAAGFHGARDLAEAGLNDVCRMSGLSDGVSRRLLRAAQEMLNPSPERKARAPRNGLTAMPGATSSSVGLSDEKHRGLGDATGARPVGQTGDSLAEGGRGVSKAESSALTGEAPREEPTPPSFWRFG